MSFPTGCMALLASVLILLGGALTILIFLSGTWGLGHGYPILVVSIPLLIFGLLLLRFLKKTRRI